MSTPYLGQIQAFPFGFAPRYWAACNGQLLSINQNQPLFSLLGTLYGGDGRVTFALPNLQGRFIVGQAPGFDLGTAAGEALHTLSGLEIPPHTHPMVAATGTPNTSEPLNAFPTSYTGAKMFATPANTTLGSGSSQNPGGVGHNNMQPYLVLGLYIATSGIYPSRT